MMPGPRQEFEEPPTQGAGRLARRSSCTLYIYALLKGFGSSNNISYHGLH